MYTYIYDTDFLYFVFASKKFLAFISVKTSFKILMKSLSISTILSNKNEELNRYNVYHKPFQLTTTFYSKLCLKLFMNLL